MSDAEVILVDTDNTVSVERAEVEIVELENGDLLIVQESDINIVAVAEQGPPGPPGDSVVYAKRVDIVGDVIYKGEATPGSLDSDPVWRISRVTIVGNSVSEHWPDGLATFSNVWDNHSLLTYY